MQLWKNILPGRMIVGIGLGDSSVETMGMKPAKLSYFEKTMQDLRDLLAGKEVPARYWQDSSPESVQEQSSHLHRCQWAKISSFRVASPMELSCWSVSQMSISLTQRRKLLREQKPRAEAGRY